MLYAKEELNKRKAHITDSEKWKTYEALPKLYSIYNNMCATSISKSPKGTRAMVVSGMRESGTRERVTREKE
jgi:hypothetical protein